MRKHQEIIEYLKTLPENDFTRVMILGESKEEIDKKKRIEEDIDKRIKITDLNDGSFYAEIADLDLTHFYN